MDNHESGNDDEGFFGGEFFSEKDIRTENGKVEHGGSKPSQEHSESSDGITFCPNKKFIFSIFADLLKGFKGRYRERKLYNAQEFAFKTGHFDVFDTSQDFCDSLGSYIFLCHNLFLISVGKGFYYIETKGIILVGCFRQ